MAYIVNIDHDKKLYYKKSAEGILSRQGEWFQDKEKATWFPSTTSFETRNLDTVMRIELDKLKQEFPSLHFEFEYL